MHIFSFVSHLKTLARREYQNGFSLIELIVVISILGILSSIGYSSYRSSQLEAKAHRIAQDYNTIRAAWLQWSTRNPGSLYPLETAFGTSGHPCSPDPYIHQTSINSYFKNYLIDPWGREYMYDSDNNTFPGGGITAGVNVEIRWCSNGYDYITIAAIVDRMIDNGNGATTGNVRWHTTAASAGSIFLMIATNRSS